MVFDHIQGQASAIETLTRALGSDRVHHAYRFEGPEGVGKRLAALALAQSLVCTSEGPIGCGQCRACHKAITYSEEPPHVPLHPDVLLVGRGVYPTSILGEHARELTLISVEQIRRVVLGRVAYAPHEARKLVVIIEQAELLSISAANALLKTLEEPPAYMHFILLTHQPQRLLDTVRSRSLAVRFAPLSDALLEQILRERGHDPKAVGFAGGSASRALELSDPEALARRIEFVEQTERAIDFADASLALDFAKDQSKERADLSVDLAHLAQHFALLARAQVLSPETAGHTLQTGLVQASRHQVVTSAIDALGKNGQPALVLESMLIELRRVPAQV